MIKPIWVKAETHQAFKRYCETFGFKMGDKADQVITDYLLKEAGIKVEQ